MKGGRSARNHFLLFAWACDYITGGAVARCHSHRLPRSRWRQRTRIAENSLQNARKRLLNANPIASSKPSRYDCYDNKCEHCPVSLPPRSLAHPNFFLARVTATTMQSASSSGPDPALYPFLKYYLDFAYMRLAKYIWPYSDDLR